MHVSSDIFLQHSENCRLFRIFDVYCIFYNVMNFMPNRSESLNIPFTQKKVALFSTNFCPYSQTFVYDEVTSHERYVADVFTLNRQNEEQFPYDRVFEFDHTLCGAVEKKLYQTFLISPYRQYQLARGNYDILAAHFGPGSLYALQFAYRSNLPLIATYHGYDVPLLLTKRRFQPQFWRYWGISHWMFKRVDRFLAASDELHRLLIELGAPREKVFTWRLGVRIPDMKAPPPRNGKRLIQCGRFVEKKGFLDTLKAFAIVRNTYLNRNQPFDLHLDLVGDGPLLGKCQAFVAQNDLQNSVHFLSALDQNSFFARLAQSDILLCPSVVASNGDRESGILVAKEAGARFVPVIGTYHGGIPEIIDHEKTGFLVQEHSPDQIAQKLLLLLENDSLRRDMGFAARKKIETEYKLEDRVRVLEDHYDQTIEETKNRPKRRWT